ncbi:hypothetical protein ACTFJW_15755 [Clostridium cagae]|uniref:hypothetical protein n=1 Tax=Clostridium cagae TaxID=2080751 RepID=UPI003F75E2BE
MNFEPINIKEIEKDIEEMSNEDIIEKYKIRCYSGRTAPMGIKANGDLFINGEYIRILVDELKKRNLHQHLLGIDLKRD